MHQHKSLSGFKITDTTKGEFEAVFATLNVKDHDGDVTVPGAFENGAEVRVSAYNHKSWEGALPVGKGVIREEGDTVVIKGKFFIDTEAGRDTFTVVKEMGDLQEWSYGYDTLEQESGTHKGKPANIIKKQKVYEVSPVILGAGLETRTTAIKSRVQESDQMKQLYSDVYWMLRDLGRERFNAHDTYVSVSDFDIDEDYVVYRIITEDEGVKYVKVSYSRGANGSIELSEEEEEEVEATTVYVTARKDEGAEHGTKDGEPSGEGGEDVSAETGTDVETEPSAEESGDEPAAEEEQEEPPALSEEELDAALKGRRVDLDIKGHGATEQIKQLMREFERELSEQGSDRFGGNNIYVCVRDLDIDEDWVIFDIWDRNQSSDTYMKVSFTRGDEGVELADSAEEVEIETTYITAKSEYGKGADTDSHDEKKAIPPKSTPTSDEAWDGPGTVSSIPNDAGAAVFRKMFAWVDPDGDPDKKSSYKFIHHEWVDGKPGPANLKACSNGIGILNGGRGGTNIPKADRQGVYNHLARHLKDGDREPPELKEISDVPGMKFSEHIEAVMTEIDGLAERAASVVTLRAEKGKKRLGDESLTLLKELTARVESLKGFLEKCDNNDVLSEVDRAYLDEIARSID